MINLQRNGSTVRRRTYLATAGAILAGGLAGCSGSDSTADGNFSELFGQNTSTPGEGANTRARTATAGDRGDRETPADTATGGTAGDPAGAVTRFSLALADGDVETAASLLHPDSELTERDLRQAATEFQRVDFSLDDVSVLDRDADTALVAVAATATRDGERETTDTRFEVRLDGGRWKINGEAYGREALTATPEPATGTPTPADVDGNPVEVVERVYAALDAADVGAANELLHPDGPAPEVPEEAADRYRQMDLGVDRARLVDRSGGAVTVRATVTVVDGDTTQTNDVDVELRRTANGRWRVWRIRPVSDE